ncbi:MAG: DUF4056 domain-containing protein, partial [Anaerolineae bacterium]|nr:DUF4056 domain-containing protein [Anaerolineae bacterium]
MRSAYSVRTNYRSDTPIQLANRACTALLGISIEAGKTLQKLGIETIFDLGASHLFGTTREIVEAASPSSDNSIGRVSADYVDASARDLKIGELADSSIEILRTIGKKTAEEIDKNLGLTTIREMAFWPPYVTARAILNDAYGFPESIVDDPERPDDLIPVSRRYATERVQYDVIVLDEILKAPSNGKKLGRLPHVLIDFDTGTQIDTTMPLDLRTAGGIDVSDIVQASLFAQPAIGAILTYRQSWFPQGLALGQLLHSMALAPGESTRIAMVDWTRRVRGSTTEDTTQAEQLTAEIGRNRSISEVTGSVAREAQSGFSESKSNAIQTQFGVTAGRAGSGITFFEDGLVGLKSTSSGMSFGIGTSSAWASSRSSSQGEREINSSMMQNISDRTQQSANSVRNRRATTVVETSQAESENLSTRVVTNYNHMHALTIQYFEVVQIYRVVLELAEASKCLFIPMKLVTFNERVIQRYRGVIAMAGLIPEVRALNFAEGDQLAILMPRRISPWNVGQINDLKRVLNEEVGSANDVSVSLPRFGLKLYAFGSEDPTFLEQFDAVIVYLNDGNRLTLPLSDRRPKTNDGVSPAHAWTPYGTDFAELYGRNLRAITLQKNKDAENLNSSVSVRILFNIKRPDGTWASDLEDRLFFVLGNDIQVSTESNETIAFEFRTTLATSELLSHLEQNALHYSSAIWRSLDAATITTLLSSYSLDNERLIESIDPIPVTISGNYLVFRFYGKLETESVAKMLQLKANVEPTEDLVPLPSGGVFAEAVLGRSNSAEKLDITRFWNWQDSPIPILPPEINPLTAGGKANDPNPQTGQLEGSVVNIVNPPNLPDPAGLAPLYNAIANGNMFRDMSGLAQTAALAQAALQAAQTGAGQATTAAGQAQQVAAQQLSEFMKLVAQVALAAISGGAGGALGAAGGALAGAAVKPGVTNTPTNAGALINQGRSMDERGGGGSSTGNSPSRLRDEDDPAAEWAEYPGTSSGLGDYPTSNEKRATEVALTGSGDGSRLPGALMGFVENAAKGALPPSSSVKVSETNPGRRWCCGLGINGSVDLSSLAGHKKGGLRPGGSKGYVYTAAVGLVDIAHVRDAADMTKFIYDAMMSGATSFELYEGHV